MQLNGRLFGRIKAVRQIVLALTKSIVPVMNAFCIMFIAICICEYTHLFSARCSKLWTNHSWLWNFGTSFYHSHFYETRVTSALKKKKPELLVHWKGFSWYLSTDSSCVIVCFNLPVWDDSVFVNVSVFVVCVPACAYRWHSWGELTSRRWSCRIWFFQVCPMNKMLRSRKLCCVSWLTGFFWSSLAFVALFKMVIGPPLNGLHFLNADGWKLYSWCPHTGPKDFFCYLFVVLNLFIAMNANILPLSWS